MRRAGLTRTPRWSTRATLPRSAPPRGSATRAAWRSRYCSPTQRCAAHLAPLPQRAAPAPSAPQLDPRVPHTCARAARRWCWRPRRPRRRCRRRRRRPPTAAARSPSPSCASRPRRSGWPRAASSPLPCRSRWCWGRSARARSSRSPTASSATTTPAGPRSPYLSTSTARACARTCSPRTSCPTASRPTCTTTGACCWTRWRWTLWCRRPGPPRCRRRCSRPCRWPTCSTSSPSPPAARRPSSRTSR